MPCELMERITNDLWTSTSAWCIGYGSNDAEKCLEKKPHLTWGYLQCKAYASGLIHAKLKETASNVLYVLFAWNWNNLPIFAWCGGKSACANIIFIKVTESYSNWFARQNALYWALTCIPALLFPNLSLSISKCLLIIANESGEALRDVCWKKWSHVAVVV